MTRLKDMDLLTDFNLSGRNILVTGASSGLGREIAIVCSEAGASLALVGRNIDALENTLSKLRPGNHHFYSCDVTEGEAYTDLFNSIKHDLGPLSGFVHSAGVEISLPMRVNSAKVYENVLDVNTIAAFELSRFLLKKKYRDEKVSIVLLASIMALVGAPAQTAYAISKGGLVAGAKSAALEYAKVGVRFNCVSPGFIEGTAMSDELFGKLPLESQRKLIDNYPIGLGKPRDVGNACAFLLSNASRWITGTNLMVDGGYTAH